MYNHDGEAANVGASMAGWCFQTGLDEDTLVAAKQVFNFN